MKLLLFTLSALLIFPAFAQDTNFVRGNEAYANSDYETALVEYNKVVGSEKMSAELYYNLGNTYYKLDELGEAIWAYEKALKIDPGNSNARFNLEFANAKTYDGIENDESGILSWLKINLFQFSINFWAYASIIFSFLLAFSLYFFFTTRNQKIKNTSLTLGFCSVFLVCTALVLAYLNKANIVDRTHAVIVIESVDIHTSPSETAPSAFKLHEGTKVDLLRSNDAWTEVSVNGNTGWVPKESIWEI